MSDRCQWIPDSAVVFSGDYTNGGNTKSKTRSFLLLLFLWRGGGGGAVDVIDLSMLLS